MLDAANPSLTRLRPAYLKQYPLLAGTDADSQALSAIVSGRVIDGIKLHADLVQAGSALPAQPALSTADQQLVLTIAQPSNYRHLGRQLADRWPSIAAFQPAVNQHNLCALGNDFSIEFRIPFGRRSDNQSVGARQQHGDLGVAIGQCLGHQLRFVPLGY
jgi:hypothetical protein